MDSATENAPQGPSSKPGSEAGEADAKGREPNPRAGRPDPGDARTPDGVTVRCWGTRGSIPSPGSRTVEFGGNTTCVELDAGGRRLIFDAGSGIRPLGLDIVQGGSESVPIFLTHFHWDHIQGFPFFAPLYDPGSRIHVVGPKQEGVDVEDLLARQMGPVYFPVPFSFVAAEMEFEHLNGGEYETGGVLLEVMRVRHPSFVLGYRITVSGTVVCFIPDNELDGATYGEPGPGFDKRIVDFVEGADLLIHDSMYTEEEYERRAGWGHSTFEQAFRLARDGGVKQLLFFHHDPTRTDYELEAIVARMREVAGRDGNGLLVEGAKEGVDYTLGNQ